MAHPRREMPYGFAEEADVTHKYLLKKYHCSAEQVKRWREELGVRPRFRAEITVLQYKLDGETLVAEYPSLHAAGRALGVNWECIQACVSGRTRTAYGFIWRAKGADNLS